MVKKKHNLFGDKKNVIENTIQQFIWGVKTSFFHVSFYLFLHIKVYEVLNKSGSFSALRSVTEPPPADNKSIKLVRMRNPWGVFNQQKQWSGKWCKGARDWTQVSDAVKSAVGAEKQDDGEFIISFDDLLAFYDTMDIVHIELNAMYNPSGSNSFNLKWASKQFAGEWISGKNAGGCGNGDFKSYWLNPQYAITFPQVKNNNDLSVVISLIQTESVRLRSEGKAPFEPICFRIYSIKNDAHGKPVPTNGSPIDFSLLEEAGKMPIYLATREISKRFTLKPGNYVIIPSTFDKNKNMKFVLRVYYESESGDSNPAASTNANKIPTNMNDDKNKTSPAVLPLPPISNNDSKKPNGVSQMEESVDLNDKYNQWFYGGLNAAQISNVVKDAKIATSKLLYK